MVMATIDAALLGLLVDAANEWSYELTGHIAPASREFGDNESAEAQEEQAEEIDSAARRANAAILAAIKAAKQ